MLASKMKTFSPPASMHLQPNRRFSFVCLLSEVNLEGPRITMETNLKGLSGGEFQRVLINVGKPVLTLSGTIPWDQVKS